jgi:hypothetical protein
MPANRTERRQTAKFKSSVIYKPLPTPVYFYRRTMAHAVKGAIAAQIRRLYQGGPRLFCTYSRGPHELSTKHLQNADVLLNNLKSAGTTRSVLEMVAQHNKIMNNKHVLQALRSLFILQKNGKYGPRTRDVLPLKVVFQLGFVDWGALGAQRLQEVVPTVAHPRREHRAERDH